jgi:predicted N-acetyltransferase YhbS
MKLVPAVGPALEHVLDSSHDLWSDGLSRRAYERYNATQLATPWGSQHLRRVALVGDDGDVLSSAKQYDLRARLDGREIAVVGIGAVFTPPAVRGRGHARELVERVLASASARGAELALLFSEIDPSYYAALGFVPVPRRELLVRTKEKAGAPMIAVRSGEDRDIPAVTALATSMDARHRFALVHTDDSVRFSLSKKRLLAGLLPPGLLTVEFFVVEEGGCAVAFAILTTTEEDVVLEMCGDRDPRGSRVGALLQVWRARTPSMPARALSCFLPPNWLPPQLEIESSSLVREVMMVLPLRQGILRRPLHADDVLYWHGDLF